MKSLIICTVHLNVIRVFISVRMMRVGHGGDEKCVQNFVRRPQGKRVFGRPRRKWEENIN